MCDPIQTSVITIYVTLFKLLLSPCVLPYSNFCYQNKCASRQITICMTLFKLVITMCVALFKLLLSPFVVPYSNFCYHHVCYPIQTSAIITCVALFYF